MNMSQGLKHHSDVGEDKNTLKLIKIKDQLMSSWFVFVLPADHIFLINRSVVRMDKKSTDF